MDRRGDSSTGAGIQHAVEKGNTYSSLRGEHLKIQKIVGIGTLFVLFLVTFALLAFIVILPEHKSHSVLLEYLKVILSWPGVALLISIIAVYLFSLIYPRKSGIKYIETSKPKVTGFINVVGHTEEGNIIIKSDKSQKIQDGDVIVNKDFVLNFLDNKLDLKKVRLELKRYQEKLLEK